MKKKFCEMYDKQHSRERKHRINIKLNPWKETNPVVQGARAWIHTLETTDIKRPPALVIVSETKLGKTEFINDLLKEKQVDEFRGRIMIDGHDENREYDFRLFDDANLSSIDWEDFKAMISTRGEKVRVNVKYGHLDVITVPTIIVLNPGSFKELQTMAGNKGDRDWLDKNTVVLSTKEKLYIENNNNNDDRIAMLQELYGELPPNLINAIAANDRLQEELPPIDTMDDIDDNYIDEILNDMEMTDVPEQLPPTNNIDDVDDNYLDEILNDMEMTDVPEEVVRRDVFDLPLKRKEPILTTEESNLSNTLPEDEIQK
ncbi:hypothetical protein EHI8A_185600 [Entamoeba histolytica HM-1:IMSS-B]|nr:hypothetical protein EHI8A_185600 [Entamoeba histolytica HM-1:IMSS-B]